MKSPTSTTAAALCALLAWGGAANACAIKMSFDWKPDEIRWIGPCDGGVVEGSGVLLHKGQKESHTFIGDFKDGRFVRGLFEKGKISKTVRIGDDDRVADENRSQRVDSLKVAIAAMYAASTWLLKDKKPEESKAYAARARDLQGKLFDFHVP